MKCIVGTSFLGSHCEVKRTQTRRPIPVDCLGNTARASRKRFSHRLTIGMQSATPTSSRFYCARHFFLCIAPQLRHCLRSSASIFSQRSELRTVLPSPSKHLSHTLPQLQIFHCRTRQQHVCPCFNASI